MYARLLLHLSACPLWSCNLVNYQGPWGYEGSLISVYLFIHVYSAQTENIHALSAPEALNENLLAIGKAYGIAIYEGFSALLDKSHFFDRIHV